MYKGAQEINRAANLNLPRFERALNWGKSMAIINRFAEILSEISTWRRNIHAYPELRFQEHRTAAFVASKLKELSLIHI